MTKQEAIQAMKEGAKVQHRYFTDNEWMSSNESGIIYTLEDGVKCNQDEFWKYRQEPFWQIGWSIYSQM